MKLLFVISSLGCGGAERAMSELASYWARTGCAVTVVTLTNNDENDFYLLDPAIHRLRPVVDAMPTNSKVLRNLQRLSMLRRVIADVRPAAVVSFIDVTNVMTLLATRGLRMRVIVSERTDPARNPTVGRLWRIGRKLTYQWADFVVGQTEAASEWLRRHCGARAIVIPNALRELGDPAGPREQLVLSIGRLDALKGHDMVLRAFARTRKAFPDWRLHILGEGPERAALEGLIASLGLQGSAILQGAVSDVEGWLGRASIVAQGSRLEGFPNALLEAMGMGAAVISTDCRSGPGELIEHEQNGLLVPVDDAEAMTTGMLDLMGSADLRERLGLAAIAVRERFSERRVMALWGRLLPKGS